MHTSRPQPAAPHRPARRHRGRRAAALLALGPLALTGCSSVGGLLDGSEPAPLVGIAMPTTTSDRWIADGDNLEAQLSSLGYRVDLRYAEDVAEDQADQIAAMLDAGADALVVGAVDGTVLADVLERAHDAGVDVVAYDRLIRDTTAVSAYASFDNHAVGVQQATSLLQGLGVLDAAGAPTGATGPFVVELFAGSPDDNNATVFWQGAMEVLGPHLDAGTLVVPSGQTTFEAAATPKWSGETAAERFATQLAPLYGEGRRLDGILSPYDGISRALLAEVAAVQDEVPVVTGQDAEVDSAVSIVDGGQYSTVYKDTRVLAEVAVQMTRDLLADGTPEVNDTTSYDNGSMVVPAYLLRPQLVTATNLRAVLVDGGYYTAEEVGA
ncbi:sugar-binding protein [Cellulomonas endophytica]|uniref:substrate-binding domain-containing protein n=1 Tax=Cellulomonas endophytica TaxID=2494735 RepID=UPI001F0C4C12|nr:sugar-binding protein [Cellulomonas endophytica]